MLCVSARGRQSTRCVCDVTLSGDILLLPRSERSERSGSTTNIGRSYLVGGSCTFVGRHTQSASKVGRKMLGFWWNLKLKLSGLIPRDWLTRKKICVLAARTNCSGRHNNEQKHAQSACFCLEMDENWKKGFLDYQAHDLLLQAIILHA